MPEGVEHHAAGVTARAACAQGPRVTQTAVMSAVFFTLFEFWKAQLKGPGTRAPGDRRAPARARPAPGGGRRRQRRQASRSLLMRPHRGEVHDD